MLVKELMSKNPVTALPETTHKQASELMKERNIHHLPIVDKRGRLVGIIVDEDLYNAQPSPATTLSIYEIHSLLSKLQIKEIMRHPVYTVNTDCTLEEAAGLMLKENIGCVPIMEQDHVVGIITDTDIFRAFVTMLGGHAEGARFTVRVPDKPGILARIAQAVTNAGGNIISVTTWKDDASHITIKEQGADFAQLQSALAAIDAAVEDVREKPQGIYQQYG